MKQLRNIFGLHEKSSIFSQNQGHIAGKLQLGLQVGIGFEYAPGHLIELNAELSTGLANARSAIVDASCRVAAEGWLNLTISLLTVHR